MSKKPIRNDNVDYRIEPRSKNQNNEDKLSFWQVAAYILIVAMLFTSFIIIFNLNKEIFNLNKENSYLFKENSDLRSTIRGKTTSLYPDFAKRYLFINGQSAICVQGTWNENNEWDETADTSTLVWSDDDISQSISQSGLKLPCEDLSKLKLLKEK